VGVRGRRGIALAVSSSDRLVSVRAYRCRVPPAPSLLRLHHFLLLIVPTSEPPAHPSPKPKSTSPQPRRHPTLCDHVPPRPAAASASALPAFPVVRSIPTARAIVRGGVFIGRLRDR